MNKIYSLIIFIFCFTNVNSQVEKDDYKIINQVLPNLIGINNLAELTIYEKSCSFENQKKIFSKSFFQNYTYPTLGVDSDKIKRLIKTLDFNYLSNQKRKNSDWDFDRIKFKITKYREDPKSVFNGIKRFRISKPIYTKNHQIAFIFYSTICGVPDCGSSTVKVYEKIKGKWLFYTQIPISMS